VVTEPRTFVANAKIAQFLQSPSPSLELRPLTRLVAIGEGHNHHDVIDGIRVDLRSDAKPSSQALLGAKLGWKISVDGRVTLSIKQGFSEHAAYTQYFRTGSGRHVVKVLKNNIVVKTTVVRA